MLSVLYHPLYCVASIAAVGAYALLTTLQWPIMWAVLQRLFIILLIEKTFFIFYLGPGWRWNLGSLWIYWHYVSTALFFILVGMTTERLSKYIYRCNCGSASDMNDVARLTHFSVSFLWFGILESIRQNRNDIEPCIELCQRIKRTTSDRKLYILFSLLSFPVVLLGVAVLFGFLLKLPYMQAIFWHCISEQLGYYGSIVYLELIAIPFTDMAETLLFLVHTYWFPELIPERTVLIYSADEWTWKKLMMAEGFKQMAFGVVFSMFVRGF
ncbi:hypothetical protein F5884DRAFT_464504 [Xylogone sp. PMI_703]|nr:hypothetical protein F5884DRAFT_464504 [Xylogone sp. PMI_703]